MVSGAFKLVISEKNVSDAASDDWNAVCPISNTGIPEVFQDEADWFKVDSLLSTSRLSRLAY